MGSRLEVDPQARVSPQIRSATEAIRTPLADPCQDRRVKVNTPLGEYPFEFRAIERRGGTLVISGTVAGLESSAVLGKEDAAAALKVAAPALGVAILAAIALGRALRRAS